MAETTREKGPVLSVIGKRLRALRKKLNRISSIEKAIAQGKPVDKYQEELLTSKPYILASIDELQNLRAPLTSAVAEEFSLALSRNDDDAKSSSARRWLSNSQQSIYPSSNGSYSLLREIFNNIISSDYFTTNPQQECKKTFQPHLIRLVLLEPNSEGVNSLSPAGRIVIRFLVNNLLPNCNLSRIIEELFPCKQLIPEDVMHLILMLKNTQLLKDEKWRRFIAAHPCHWGGADLEQCFNLLKKTIEKKPLKSHQVNYALESMPHTCFPNGQLNWERELEIIAFKCEFRFSSVIGVRKWMLERARKKGIVAKRQRSNGEASIYLFYFISWLFSQLTYNNQEDTHEVPFLLGKTREDILLELLVLFPGFVTNFLFCFMEKLYDYADPCFWDFGGGGF